MAYDIVVVIVPISAVGTLCLVSVLDDAIDWVFFDLRYDVDTSGRGPMTGVANFGGAIGMHHVPTPVRTIRSILASLPIDHGEFSFIDFGSGKGRALLVAAEFGFRRIVGIERSPELIAIAHHNLNRSRNLILKGHDVETKCIDAAQFKFPEGPLVLFFYNPFSMNVMASVMENLAHAMKTAPRPILLVYYHPQCQSLLHALPSFERIGLPGANTDYYKVFGAALSH